MANYFKTTKFPTDESEIFAVFKESEGKLKSIEVHPDEFERLMSLLFPKTAKTKNPWRKPYFILGSKIMTKPPLSDALKDCAFPTDKLEAEYKREHVIKIRKDLKNINGTVTYQYSS